MPSDCDVRSWASTSPSFSRCRPGCDCKSWLGVATILIDLCHPGDIHLFRRAGLAWEAQGHRVVYSSLDRETNAYLLDHYGLPHRVVWRRRPGKLALLTELLLRPWPLLRLPTVSGPFCPGRFTAPGAQASFPSVL